MLVDLIIILLLVSALFRGREIGFVQQLFSTSGFFGGLLIGALLQPHTVNWVHGQTSRSLVTLVTTLGIAFLLLAVGEIIGAHLKRKLQLGKLNQVDNGLGSALSIISILVAVWLSATVIKTVPYPGLQNAVRESKIVSTLSRRLPYAPNLISGLGHLIDPNGFPQVFTAGEPNPPGKINLPSSSELVAAVDNDRASVVKVVGRGCGGVVDGSGFVVGSDLVVTNAHVVAGIDHQFVTDAKGSHTATAIWFDPNLDLAILRVSNLAGSPLSLNTTTVADKTSAAVLGYPGGGAFTANPASIIDQFKATGRDIYGSGTTNRNIYEVAADIEPGNSGGPLVTSDGTVVGVIFARSTTYNSVGYALTMQPVTSAIAKATASGTTVDTGSCAH